MPADQPDRRALIQTIETAVAALPDAGAVPPGFTAAFLKRVPSAELASRPAPEMAQLVHSMARLAARRRAGEVVLRVFNPEAQRDGWESPHTIIQIVNDDMPFLVDSATMVLAEAGVAVHLIIHPVINAQRDAAGVLHSLVPADDVTGQSESLIYFEIDRQVGGAGFAHLEQRLRKSFSDVALAVEDWAAMRDQAAAIAARLPAIASCIGAEICAEAAAFIDWLAGDHFTFLGFREYVVEEVGGEREMRIVEGSGLGILRRISPDHRPRKLASLSSAARDVEHRHHPIIITKTNARSTVHRTGYMDYIGVLRYDQSGKVIGEYRILGLFTSGAYHRRVRETPLIRQKAVEVLERSGLRPRSHESKALQHILETLPRDELFQSTSDELFELAMGVLDLQERPQTRLFVRRERYGRFYSCMVYIPRDRFNTETRERIQAILKRALRGEQIDFTVQVSESNLARLHVIIRSRERGAFSFDRDEIEKRIVLAVRSWLDELRALLVKAHGELEGLRLTEQIGKALPVAYSGEVTPSVAVGDVMKIAELLTHRGLAISLYRPRIRTGAQRRMLRCKLFLHNQAQPLSRIFPIFESMGLKMISERPYEVDLGPNTTVWIQDFDMEPAVEQRLELETVEASFTRALQHLVDGTMESDGFNRQIVQAQMVPRQVTLLRALSRYLLQTGMPFSQTYMEEVISRYPLLARLLVALFENHFAPSGSGGKARRELKHALRWLLSGEGESPFTDSVRRVIAERGAERAVRIDALRRAIESGLEAISSQDDDRILRGFYELIEAALRTNYFQPPDPEFGEYLCFKFDSSKVPELPKPRPYRETWVYSPRVEGVHLRAGPVARGGLRWSDRREDFRTEVLGLMKAQNVKNTLIVPVGAKGGFVVKRPPAGDRQALYDEVVYCYRTFITALLALADNRVGKRIQPPPGLVRRDGDDPYLVVAADKGTATFSDIANRIALDKGFWLGDAFASGGSNGYDHKAMAITAKGAWECVKRHFRELGRDIQKEPFTVVGIGDMSGDVFGNGMLLSPHIRLMGAFNHQHIFIDPDPDCARSLEERERLFKLPRSSWDDYDRARLSPGGGIWRRDAKSIELTPEVRAWLSLQAQRVTPQELIRALLRAPVDLLWNGGIGTYVKAGSESHADVGDRTNNAVRINASELRCKVIGEGGNLGLTQLARIEFAARGGRLNTDFIDNSAGVDCSDHEVNIKILFREAGDKIGADERNRMLRDMQDEVERLVLRGNYLQSQSISHMETLANARLGAQMHLIATLERLGLLDRELEFLPSDEQLRERMNRGAALSRPELAVLLSYSKIHVYRELLAGDGPDDPYMVRELVNYFPSALRHGEWREIMLRHPLQREIIATRLTNNIVNRMGASFVLRVQEDTGADIASVIKAYAVAREVFAVRKLWKRIEALDNTVPARVQSEAMLRLWNVLRQAVRWFLNRPGSEPLAIQPLIDRYAPGIAAARRLLREHLPPAHSAVFERDLAHFTSAGFDSELAAELALCPWFIDLLDIVDQSLLAGKPLPQVVTVYYELDRLLGLDWLHREIEELPAHGDWDAHARGHLRNDMQLQHRLLTGQVLNLDSGEDGRRQVALWAEKHSGRLARLSVILDEMRSRPGADFATVTVATRSLAQMVTAGE